ncbi:MAG: fumarylacetoacetate hydrolase family protein [Verrucomicrobia bacterium]|jgi:2-keto-4-pentenoate hydratase/2-oxohepta-3-ene-1,7-dioic acid hydratase in catechol pathway|nr:fumarylacetoacetate hydrolase family protein [Verrucomicrobiota bacterium]NMD21158.1 fumarylacetoacetate hydrolase family protein [Verrucomicrobiota bacterium]OQC63576.1 MAG: Ureidoglycolate lyase [Verrucomicrobia bacterium ADurb.Bin006]
MQWRKVVVCANRLLPPFVRKWFHPSNNAHECNDVSERYWQNDEQDKDIQWWRAKGSDTFGPVGPWIVTGLDWSNLELRVRVNGEVKQQDRTSRLIHDAAGIVSMISRYVTLQPGDLIFTGTPGATSALKPGDVVEVEIEGIGVLRNSVE